MGGSWYDVGGWLKLVAGLRGDLPDASLCCSAGSTPSRLRCQVGFAARRWPFLTPWMHLLRTPVPVCTDAPPLHAPHCLLSFPLFLRGRDEGRDILIVARTDSRQAESLQEALWRAAAFADVRVCTACEGLGWAQWPRPNCFCSAASRLRRSCAGVLWPWHALHSGSRRRHSSRYSLCCRRARTWCSSMRWRALLRWRPCARCRARTRCADIDAGGCCGRCCCRHLGVPLSSRAAMPVHCFVPRTSCIAARGGASIVRSPPPMASMLVGGSTGPLPTHRAAA